MLYQTVIVINTTIYNYLERNKMRLLAIIVLTFVTTSKAQNSNFYNLLDELAQSKGFEAVYGDKYPLRNIYGSNGSPIIIDFLYEKSIEDSVLFLVRKRNQQNFSDKISKFKELIVYYDYYILFAVKKSKKPYKILSILPASLKGMSIINRGLWPGDCLDNLKYHKIKNQVNLEDLSSISFTELILIQSDSATVILKLEGGKWMEHVSSDL